MNASSEINSATNRTTGINRGTFQILLKFTVGDLNFFCFFFFVSPWELSVAMETTILIQFVSKPNAVNLQSNDDSHCI